MKARVQLKIAPDPALLPVSLEEVKDFLRIDETTTEEDSELTNLINAATVRLEKYLDIKLMFQVWYLFYDSFGVQRSRDYDAIIDSGQAPRSLLFSQCNYLSIPFGNVYSVDKLEVTDEDDNTTTFDSSNYDVDTVGNPGRIALKRNAIWPDVVLKTVNAIRITLNLGYDDAENVPANIKQALLIYVANLYETRGDDSSEESKIAIPKAALAVLQADYIYKL